MHLVISSSSHLLPYFYSFSFLHLLLFLPSVLPHLFLIASSSLSSHSSPLFIFLNAFPLSSYPPSPPHLLLLLSPFSPFLLPFFLPAVPLSLRVVLFRYRDRVWLDIVLTQSCIEQYQTENTQPLPESIQLFGCEADEGGGCGISLWYCLTRLNPVAIIIKYLFSRMLKNCLQNLHESSQHHVH